jgi:hypothetical protein
MLSSSGSNNSNNNTAASNRVRRAQQLRQQRMAAANKANVSSPSKPTPSSAQTSPKAQETKDDEILVISGIWTLVAAIFIVFLGAAMATIFFLIYQPECMKGILWGDAIGSVPIQTTITKGATGATGAR